MLKVGGKPPFAALEYHPRTFNPPIPFVPPSLVPCPEREFHVRMTDRICGENLYTRRNPDRGAVSELLRNHVSLPYAIGSGQLADTDLNLPVPGKRGKPYPDAFVIRALLYRDVRNDLDSDHDISSHLNAHPDVAACFGFSKRVPSRDTFRRAWLGLSDRQQRRLSELAARIATIAVDEGYEGIDTSVIVTDAVDSTDATPTLLDSEKDRAFRRVEDHLKEIIDFGRASNASIQRESLVEMAGYLARRNTYPQQGAVRADIEGENSIDAETYRSTVRNKTRDKARTRDDRTVYLKPRDWNIDINRQRGDTSDWHGTLEVSIERLVGILKDEGVIDGPLSVNLDGSKRLYHKHPEGADNIPAGVYQESRFSTNYAWKDMSVNAVVNGRSIVLANISRVPGDKFFKAVKYLIDRSRELVNVDCFYADAAFSNTDICRYIDRLSEEYVMKKGHRGRVKDVLNSFTGDADYQEFQMRSPRKGATHDTTLFGVEKRGQIGIKKGTRRDSETEQTGLGDFGGASGQLTFDDIAAEDNDTEFVAFVTNRDINGVGIDPSKNPIGHDSSNTVWSAAEDYRGRWSIETTFRQVKYQFLAKTRSRDLGVRRFCWMLAIILYNSWATLNLMIQKSVPTVSDDRPPVRANVFLEELAARARRWPPP